MNTRRDKKLEKKFKKMCKSQKKRAENAWRGKKMSGFERHSTKRERVQMWLSYTCRACLGDGLRSRKVDQVKLARA